jgi:hypothetical protein
MTQSTRILVTGLVLVAVTSVSGGQTILGNPTVAPGESLVLLIDGGTPLVPFALDMSVTGTWPGLLLPATGRTIPLNRPLIYLEFGGWLFPSIFQNFVGTTNVSGWAQVTFNVPGVPPLVGLELDTGFVTFDSSSPDGVGVISAAKHLMVVPSGSSGWTEFTPSPSTVQIHVSESQGSDLNSGLSPNDAVQTLAMGISLLRDGFPDWLLLRRDDVWTNENLGLWTKSGASPAERMLIGSYGSGLRPHIKTGTSSGLTVQSGPVSNLAIVGLRLEPHTYTGSEGSIGVRWQHQGENILIEDCYLLGFESNVVIDPASGWVSDVQIRRSIIADAHAMAGVSTGARFSNTHGILLEENLFDHNGWKAGVAPQVPYNHAIDVRGSCTSFVATGNLVARSSHAGLQATAGGNCDDNLFVRNPVGAAFGHVIDTTYPATPGGVGGSFSRNLIVEGVDLAYTPAAEGLYLGNLASSGTTVQGNIIAHAMGVLPPSAWAIHVSESSGPILNLTIAETISMGWEGGLYIAPPITTPGSITFTGNTVMNSCFYHGLVHDPGGVAPTLNFGGNTYHSFLSSGLPFFGAATWMDFAAWVAYSGETGSSYQGVNFAASGRHAGMYHALLGGTPSLSGFLQSARQQQRGSWNGAYTAAALGAWLRNGFAVVGP